MKRLYYTLLIAFCSLLSHLHASAQDQVLKGKVVDATTGAPVPGATISVNGSNETTTTNESGRFAIMNAGDYPTLTVSSIGYEKQIIHPGNASDFITISLTNSSIILSNVTVTGYEGNRKLLQTAGAISLLTARDIRRNSETDLLPVLNTIPGVKMEEEAPGDFKISLRGSALRDPYGLRNIKLYWNDIPLTSPDNSGSHPLNIDPGQVGSIEIIKGPAGSIYGAGIGGVLLFRNDKPKTDENTLSTTFTAGSYGLIRSSTTYKASTDDMAISANYTHQTYNGYRQQEFSDKDAVNLFGQFFISPKRTITLLANHDEGHFGIAGSVDSAWAMNTPKLAVPFCIQNNTGVRKYTYTLFGISQEYRFSDLFSNTTSVYTDFQDLNHPYGQSIYYNGFLKQSVGGYGGRTRFTFSPKLGNVQSRFIIGDEVQFERTLANTYDIDSAKTGALQSSNQINDPANILFAQAEFDLPAGFLLTLGASYNSLTYNVTDLVPSSPTHVNQTGAFHFDNTVSPRVALVKTFNKNLAAHASASWGFSPPTTSEVNNGDGTFNSSLKAEHGVNYELGMRGTILNNKLNIDGSIYQLNLTDAILPYYNPNGSTVYRNAGSTDQKGLEISLSYLLIEQTHGVTLLKPWITYAYSDYKFKNYIEESQENGQTVKTDISGNKVTGVSPNMLNAGIDLETRAGFYANTVLNYISRTPINDKNTYYQHGYTLLAVKAGYRIDLNHFGIDIFAGGNNLLNQKYSSWVNFNADASSNPPQFFNPSPTANFYGGLALKYSFTR